MSELDVIPGIKLIYQTGAIRQPEDPNMLYKLEADFRPPEFMLMAFVGLYGGSEEIVVQGESLEALDKLIKSNDLERHPRLRRLTITGPNGVEYQYPKENNLNSNAYVEQ